MDKYGYIKGLESEVEKLGGSIIEMIPLKNVDKNNPTACYIINPPTFNSNQCEENPVFCIPGTNYKLDYNENFFKQLDVIENKVLDGQSFEETSKINNLK